MTGASCANLGGCAADFTSGQYLINPLKPKLWDAEGSDDPEAPAAFRQRIRLSRRVSFLKDLFRAYKDFRGRHIDTIETDPLSPAERLPLQVRQ